MVDLVWEKMGPGSGYKRAKVPGGWLVSMAQVGSITFVPDPNHTWN
jgi:hypothetical protein